MSSDPNKKSPRTFQCRDMLWETFEQMARELECSVDYLINEAMKQYARQRSYGGRTPYPNAGGGGRRRGSRRAASRAADTRARLPAMAASAFDARRHGPMRARPRRSSASARTKRRSPRAASAAARRRNPERNGHAASAAHGHGRRCPACRVARSLRARRAARRRRSRVAHRRCRPSRCAADARAVAAATTAAGSRRRARTLSIIYQGEKVGVSKDRFVIGRGKQSSDLTLKDPNVSRQHAMIEYQNGVYFMVDMGSTNGVEYNGQRIARKQIAEGDVFRICDHDLRFTYR